MGRQRKGTRDESETEEFKLPDIGKPPLPQMNNNKVMFKSSLESNRTPTILVNSVDNLQPFEIAVNESQVERPSINEFFA
jgi:hypothetical protein